jgi:S-adenosylmethionine:tRNA ribosyltransferase-isomerase
MTAAVAPPGLAVGPSGPRLDLVLDVTRAAHEPPEARPGGQRGDVRLLVSAGDAAPRHHRFHDLPAILVPGDLLVVNNSATVAAALDAELDGEALVLHVSTELPGGLWMVEPRRRIANGSTEPRQLPDGAHTVRLAGGEAIELLRPAPGSERLWIAVAAFDVADVMVRRGRPIRYRYVERDWPLSAYQTVFARRPGSAEMPSAARPFTAELVTQLVANGVGVVPITLHTGVSSLEGHERPYPERFDVPAGTAAAVNATRAAGRHVIAVGTTVVRALESATDEAATTHPASGWTDVVITAERGVRAVDGLLSGWHEPQASHLAMLEAVAGEAALVAAYTEAFASGYRWHEFGDSHLMLPYAGR